MRARSHQFSIETLFSSIRPGEPPVITAHLRLPRRSRRAAWFPGGDSTGASLETGIISTAKLTVHESGNRRSRGPFHQSLPAGFYKISAGTRRPDIPAHSMRMASG